MRFNNTLARSKLSMAVLIAVTAAGLMALPAPSSAGPATVAAWKAVASSGPVTARLAAVRSAAWTPVTRGDELEPSTLVRTGVDGRITLTRNASLLMLDAESQVELPPAGYSGLETSVIQTSGSILYDVDSRNQPHFEVVTPYLVAGVKGTTFLVTVSDSYTSVTVEEGLVEVTNPRTGQVKQVGAGESVIQSLGTEEMDLVQDVRESRKRIARMAKKAHAATVDGEPYDIALDDLTGLDDDAAADGWTADTSLGDDDDDDRLFDDGLAGEDDESSDDDDADDDADDDGTSGGNTGGLPFDPVDPAVLPTDPLGTSAAFDSSTLGQLLNEYTRPQSPREDPRVDRSEMRERSLRDRRR